MGWVEVVADGRTVYHHGGDAIVMGSWTMLDLEKKLGVSLLYNGPALHEYRFPSKVFIVNNVLHLASGEAMSEFGRPQEADPTANDFELPAELLPRYVGNYLSSQGLRAQVSKPEDREYLILEMAAGDLEYEYELDFVTESAVVLRNLSSAQLASFLLTPDGEVTGLDGLVGGAYRRRSEEEMARFQTVSSPGGELTFVLPRAWTVSWNGAEFTARARAGGERLLSGGFEPAGRDTLIGEAWRGALERGTREAIETLGGRVWHKLLWTQGEGPGAKQILLASAEEAGTEVHLKLETPAGEITAALREVLFPLLSDLELR